VSAILECIRQRDAKPTGKMVVARGASERIIAVHRAESLTHTLPLGRKVMDANDTTGCSRNARDVRAGVVLTGA